MDDMIEKGRGYILPTLQGEESPSAILTEEIVRSIRDERNNGKSMPYLAEKHKVTKQAIWMIIHRKNWKHI